MPQNYRIYINQSTIIIANNLPIAVAMPIQIDFQNLALGDFLSTIPKDKEKTYIILTANPKKIFKAIKLQCLYIKAAGGLVASSRQKLLFISRNGMWDLPKGKAERAEKLRTTALREVEEECGIKNFYITNHLCSTYHFYQQSGRLALKKTKWFSMSIAKEEKLSPQASENITKAVWVPAAELPAIVANTYPSIKQVLDAAGFTIKQL